jgi:hypothetical protein
MISKFGLVTIDAYGLSRGMTSSPRPRDARITIDLECISPSWFDGQIGKVTHAVHQIHLGPTVSARRAATAPPPMNPIGPRAPSMANTRDRCSPGGKVRPSIATALGTMGSHRQYAITLYVDNNCRMEIMLSSLT